MCIGFYWLFIILWNNLCVPVTIGRCHDGYLFSSIHMSVIRDYIHISFLDNNSTNWYIIYTSKSIYIHTQVLDDGRGIGFRGSVIIWLFSAADGRLLLRGLQPPCGNAAIIAIGGVWHTYWDIWSGGSVNERVEDNRDGVPDLPHRRTTLRLFLHLEDDRRGYITPDHH